MPSNHIQFPLDQKMDNSLEESLKIIKYVIVSYESFMEVIYSFIDVIKP